MNFDEIWYVHQIELQAAFKFRTCRTKTVSASFRRHPVNCTKAQTQIDNNRCNDSNLLVISTASECKLLKAYMKAVGNGASCAKTHSLL